MTHPVYPDLDGASVFITGGGSGIGASFTEGFLRQGAKVAFIGRSDRSDFAAEMEEKTGRAPLFLQGDVTETGALRAAMDEAAAKNGAIDVQVNNAANDMRYDTAAVSEEDWENQIALNLSHQFFAAQHAANAMKARGAKGRIVNMTSITFKQGAGGMLPYETSKAGILGLTRGLARDYGPAGIRVNCLAPGMVLTDKQLDKWIDDEAKQAMIDDQCLKIELKPDDMIGPMLFLASAASASITGQCLIADAGVEFAG